jgi:nitroimidazol reductase NimA-like FMN-containing flavoprotein (pyridoxamine 5'-phosphate oxidase superfamily)
VVHDVRNGLEILDVTECAVLLAGTFFGRVAFVEDGEPFVFPVNYLYDGGSVVLCTASGSKLELAGQGERVAFEIDAADAQNHAGWSVLVHGTIDHVTDPDEIRRLERLPLRPWVPRARTHWVRIRPAAVTGRRIPRP